MIPVMKHIGRCAILAVAVAFTAAGMLAQGTLPTTASPRFGEQLAADLRAMRPGGSSTNTGTLRLRDAKNHRRDLPVTVVTLVREEDWSVSYQALLPDGSKETLTARYGSGQPVYELAQVRPGAAFAGAPKTLAAGATAVPFAGSDFWVCDLGLEFLHWPIQRFVKDDLSNGRLCYVLESVNPSTNGYAKVWSYIDTEFKGLLSAKAFDHRGFAVKDFSTGNFSRVKDRWFLRDIRIRDERADSRTELVYTLPPE